MSAETRADCLDVFLKHADAQGVKLYTLEPICDLSTNLQTVFTYRHLQVTLASMANYQIRNAALALKQFGGYVKKTCGNKGCADFGWFT